MTQEQSAVEKALARRADLHAQLAKQLETQPPTLEDELDKANRELEAAFEAAKEQLRAKFRAAKLPVLRRYLAALKAVQPLNADLRELEQQENWQAGVCMDTLQLLTLDLVIARVEDVLGIAAMPRPHWEPTISASEITAPVVHFS